MEHTTLEYLLRLTFGRIFRPTAGFSDRQQNFRSSLDVLQRMFQNPTKKNVLLNNSFKANERNKNYLTPEKGDRKNQIRRRFMLHY